MTLIRYGTPGWCYDPEENRMTFVQSNGLFDTRNFSEVPAWADTKDGKYVPMASFPGSNAENNVRIRILTDQNDYKQWLFDLLRYLYRYDVDHKLTSNSRRQGENFNSSQEEWLHGIYNACIQFSKLPSWLENELDSVCNFGDSFFATLVLLREKYHPENLHEEIAGFRLQKHYKLENVLRILRDFEDRIPVYGVFSLGNILLERITRELGFKKNVHGQLYRVKEKYDEGLSELIKDIQEEVDNNNIRIQNERNYRAQKNGRNRVKKDNYRSGKGSQRRSSYQKAILGRT